MKIKTCNESLLQAALCGLVLAGATSSVLAVPDKIINTFDSDITGCGNAWGAAGGSFFDPAQDATGNAGGSLYITSDYSADQNTLTYFCNEPPSGAWNFQGPGFNFTDYLSVEFDIKWDTTKTVSIADFNAPPLGGEGGIVIWATDLPGFSVRPQLGVVQVPAAAATGWAHISLPVNPAISGIDPSCGLVFKKWIAAATQTAGGTYGFWVDNVILKGSEGPPPPPTVSLANATPGLAFISASGGQYDRQNIVTVGDGYSWLNAAGPVTYSVDIAEHADNAHPGYELHFFFAPGTPDTTRSDPDWHEPSLLRWDIGNNADGSAYSTIRYKTNAVDDNGVFYSAGQLGGPNSTTIAGQWSITFNNNTNITATSASGEVFNTNLPPDVVDQLTAGGTMKVYVGSVPGATTRIGQMSVINSIQITGAAAPNLDSQFVGQPLNESDWAINAAAGTNGVRNIPTNAKYWLQWTLPALGFAPQLSAAVSGPWTDTFLSGFEAGGMHKSLLLDSDLPSADSSFFRLIKRTFTQLQILLPGESPAPNTPTGKTGTPNFVNLNVDPAMPVTVRAVDAEWNLVSSTDTIHLDLTVPDPFGAVPADRAMVNGVATFSGLDSMYFGTAGTYTVTATNMSRAMPQASSSPVTVGFQ